MFFAFDKILHFCAGLLICLFVGVSITPLVGLISATVVGAAKEVVWDDWMDKGTPEWMDFVATTVGGYLGFWWLTFFIGG